MHLAFRPDAKFVYALNELLSTVTTSMSTIGLVLSGLRIVTHVASLATY